MRTILLICLMALIVPAFGQKDLRKVRKMVSAETTRAHLEYLASDEMRGRDTGSPEIELAAEYIAGHFEKYGLMQGPEGYFQSVGLVKTLIPAGSTVTIDGNTYTHAGEMLVLDAVNGTFSGPLVMAGYGLEDDYEGIDVTDKIVVVRSGDGSAQGASAVFGLRSRKSQLASEKGARGIIELYQAVGTPWARLVTYLNRESLRLDEGESANDQLPYVWLNDPKREKESICRNTDQDATIMITGSGKQEVPGRNVFGYVEGTDPELKDEYLIITAHYDHVGVGRPVKGDSIYNGARDNAIGTVALMNTAQFLAENPPRRSVAFLAVTAEEKGLLGSAWYTRNPIIPMEQVIFDFNCDGGGYNDTTLVSVVGLGRTTVDKTLRKAVEDTGLKLGGDPAPEQGLYDRSDNVNFSKEGVPSFTFSTGFTAFDSEILKYYHQPADEVSSLNFSYLEKFNEAYVLTAWRIANMDEAPFWVEGDKYEEAGKRLYGMD